ncbi:MAG: hypothetical protein BAJALOKI3v1_390030 [Promethearchaeota archaeon]|nr:MAG: hypothetical protein BAJALOKI3v1_390030 [Candidatus Lokiarchaeota archaeon]
MSNKNKVALYFLICSFLTISLFLPLGRANGIIEFPIDMGTVGNDMEITDQTDDLYIQEGDQYVSVPTQIAWIDLKKISFADSGLNYTLTIELNEDFNETSIINIYLDVNNSGLEARNSKLQVSISPFLGGPNSRLSHEGITIQNGIHTINGNIVSFTFPKLNITDLIPNTRPIPEWRVLVRSQGDSLGTYYFDFIGFSNPIILAYPMVVIFLVSIVSIFVPLRRFKKAH